MSDYDDMDDPEGSYRRGYTQGAWDIIKFVRGKISAADQSRLETWFTKDAGEWRLKAYHGETRAPHGVTSDLFPPRHRLFSN